MKTFYNKYQNKKERRIYSSRLIFLIAVCSAFILFFLMNGFNTQVDNATIQLTKIEFSKNLCDDEIADIVQSVKEIEGVKTAVYFPKTTALVASFDNRLLSVSEVAQKINNIYPGEGKLVSNKDFPNARGCPLHKSKILSYIFNFF